MPTPSPQPEQTRARKPTLAIVAHEINNHRGMERHLAEKIRRAQHHYDITVIAIRCELHNTNVKVIRIPIPVKPAVLTCLLFAMFASLILLFRRFDIVHTTGAIIFNKTDLATVHFCHAGYRKLGIGGPFRGRTPLHRINAIIYRTVVQQLEKYCYRPFVTKRLAAVSENNRRELLEHYGYAPGAVHTVPNGVDPHHYYPPSHMEKERLRSKLELPHDAIVFLFVGGDWQRKGLRIAAEALALTRERHPQQHMILAVVGKGNEAVELAGLPETCRADIRFFGEHKDSAPFYRMADIFVLPSVYETFSLAALEAAACGLPVIMTPVGIADIVAQNEVTGYTVERNPQAFAEAMGGLICNPQLVERMGRANKARAHSLTWDACYEGFQSLYEQIIQEKYDNGRASVQFVHEGRRNLKP